MNRFIRQFSTKRVGNNFIRKKVKKPISKKKVETPFLWKGIENNKKDNKVNKKAPFLWKNINKEIKEYKKEDIKKDKETPKSVTNNYYDCPKIDKKKFKYEIPNFFDE
jgi:hypothetical protein